MSNLNPQWNNQDIDIDEQFKKAMVLVIQEFMEFVHYAKNTWLLARDIVYRAIENRFEVKDISLLLNIFDYSACINNILFIAKVDTSGEIILLSQTVPWKKHLSELEKEMNVSPPIKYVVFSGYDSYRVQCVPIALGNFTCRLFLPEMWAGLSNNALVEACGIEGARFVRASRFMGGHTTKDGALAMARKSLEIGRSILSKDNV